MLIIRGVNVHPSQVEHVLLSVEGAAPHYRLIVSRPGTLDELLLECEPADAETNWELLRRRLEHELREHVGLRIAVAVLARGTLPRSEGKAVHVIDKRAS
jgi:phenylacetate-CoA ligase